MEIWLSLGLFAIGVALVVKGGDLFVDAASWIAKASGIPPFIVGATIVSVATTLPEMIVSLLAAVQQKTDMAVGNAVGSVTANTGLILAAAMLFMPIISRRRDYLRQCILLLCAAGILWASCASGSLSAWGSGILMGIFVVFVSLNVKNARTSMEVTTGRPAVTRRAMARNGIGFALGAVGIVAGSQLLVKSGSDIAAFLQVPERIIAVTLVAIGTSLPELVTTVTAILKRESGLSIGNLIGANIIDLTLILPLCSVVSGSRLPVSQQSIQLDLPVCFGLTVLALVPLLWREKASRFQGTLLAAGYAVYLVCVL